MKKKYLILDNSISFTGAFKCALVEYELLQEKYEFVFVVPNGSAVIQLLEARSIRYYTLPILEINKSIKNIISYGPRLIGNAIAFLEIIRRENVKVVQVNDFYNLLGVLVKFLGFKGLLITYVRFLPFALPSILRRIWINLALWKSNAIIAVSDAVVKELPVHKKIFRIYDAVILPERLNPKRFDDNTILLLYLSNYIRGKGQEHALKAFKDLVKHKRNVQLKFVGGDMGLAKNKAYKEELQQFVRENGLSDFVIFEPFQADIEKLIKKADILLNFSEAESFSMTCAEASFYGIPVIATKCGGPMEIVVDKRSGLLVDKKNIEQMTEAMLTLTESKELREQYGKYAKTFVRIQFSKNQYINHFSAVLKELRVEEV